MTVKSETAARRFFNELTPGEDWNYTDHPAKSLISAAFLLYERAWTPNFNILHWKYPFTTLRDGEPFRGDEPWTVLLRRAVEISPKNLGEDDAAKQGN